MTTGPRAADRRFAVGLLLITAAGAALRVLHLITKLGDPLSISDALYYSIQAGRNSEGDWFREVLTNEPGAEHAPLTSLYLTPWSMGSGSGVTMQRVGITLVGIAVVAVIGLLGRRLAGERVGLVAAGIAAVYPNLWSNDVLVMSESLACLVVSLTLLAAVWADQSPTARRAAVIGVLVGLAVLTRSELLLLGPGLAAILLWRTRRFAAPLVVVAVAVAVVVPWSIYNLARFERPVLLSTNDGTTLRGANCDLTYNDDVGGWDTRCLGPPDDGDVDASVRSARWRSEGLTYIGDHLGRLPVVVAARMGRTLDLYGLDSTIDNDVREEKARPVVVAGVVCWWLLAVGAIGGWRGLRRTPARWFLAVPVAGVLVTTVLFYGAHRIRAPGEPAIVVLAAAGIVDLLDRRAGRSRCETRPA